MPENRKLLQDLQQVFLTYFTRSARCPRVVYESTLLHRASFRCGVSRPTEDLSHHPIRAARRVILLDNDLADCRTRLNRQVQQVHATGQPALWPPINAVQSGWHDAGGNGLDPLPG